MKIALLTDTHFGARSDSLEFDAHFRKFYDEVFFPTLKKEKIEEVWHLGDVFDKRRNVNFATLASCKEYFFDKLHELGIKMDILIGNHDTYFKNTNKINSPDLLLGQYDNIQIFTGPIDFPPRPKDKFKGLLFMPWICEENAELSAKLLEQSKSAVCMGHFEIGGFSMHKGMMNADGLDPSIFKKFKLTCSGHFHTRSTSDSIHYLGSPYDITWSDYDDPRGFHLYDPSTFELTFVENPHAMFHKVYWDNGCDVDVRTLSGKCVKLIVVNKTPENAGKLDTFVEKLTKCNPADLKIVEDFSEFESDALDDEQIAVADTITLLGEYVDALDTKVDKTRVKSLLQTLHVEAQNLE